MNVAYGSQPQFAPPGPEVQDPSQNYGSAGGGPMPYPLYEQHMALEKNMSSLMGMTGILLILAILLLLALGNSSKKNFKDYCEPLKKERYGKRKWKNNRWVYE